MRKFNTGDRVILPFMPQVTFAVAKAYVEGHFWYYDLRTDSGSISYRIAEHQMTLVSNISKWDRRHMSLARHVAKWSKDPDTKVGAVAIGQDRRQVAIGYNGFPPGISDTKQRLSHKETKYAFTQHAERNVLDNALFDLRGGTLVTTMFPCADCAKSIVSRGIRKVVTAPVPKPIPGVLTWRDTVAYSVTMFEEAGIQIVVIPEEVVSDGETRLTPFSES